MRGASSSHSGAALKIFGVMKCMLTKFCPWRGCKQIIPISERYCKEHQHQKEEQQRQRARQYNERRPEWHRLYDRDWRAYTAVYLAEHPYCVECLKKGIHTFATEVDHIIPHKGDRALFWDIKNHQGLCDSDHSRKTAKENGGFKYAKR